MTLVRVAVLVATAWLLVASSDPEGRCFATQVIVFRVEGDCGPAGVLVIEKRGYAQAVAQNAEILGVASGPVLRDETGSACGLATTTGWALGRPCSGGDAGACDARQCRPLSTDAGPMIECVGGGATCRSRLTVMP